MAKSQHAVGYRSVTKLLRDIRLESGLTQRVLADRVRKPQPWVHKSETGERRVDVHEFMIWCAACGTDPVKAFQRLESNG